MIKIYYLDTFSHGEIHEQFNSSLIKILNLLSEDVTFCMSNSAYKNSLNLIADMDFTTDKYKSIYVFKGFRGIWWVLRYLISAIQNIIFLIKLPKNSLLIFPHNNLFSLVILNLLNKYFKKRIIIFCHGEMEGLIESNNYKGLVTKFINWNLKYFFVNKNVTVSESIYFSVFGKKIKNNLMSLIDEKKHSNFICVDHPYLFDKVSTCTLKNEKIFFGSVGVFNKEKGANLFLELIDILPTRILNISNFNIIGKILDIPLIDLEKRNVKYLSQDKNLISREIYDKNIEDLDYILFFYDDNNYKVTASGAIMDALNKEKPIIALKNDYFEYLFDTYGEFGYLYNSIEDMAIGISKLVSNDINIEFNFKIIKNKFRPESIALQLKNELINNEIIY